jgi:hypothetical protein
MGVLLMRKLLILVVALAAMAAVVPANAYTIKTGKKIYSADPCAVACSYWGFDIPADPTKIDPMTYDPETIIDGERFACTKPSPAGSWGDLVVTAPTGANLLKFYGTPEGDWDLFICSKPSVGNNGRLLASGANDASDPNCIMGCPESVRIPVKAGRKYVLRAYNWLDTENLTARYAFYHV